MTVTYRLEPTGRTPHEIVEVLLTEACPTCGADWRPRGSVLPRGPQRCFLCTACGRVHDAQKVDEHGLPVEVVEWMSPRLRGRDSRGGGGGDGWLTMRA